jgi:predicted methyltransferase
MVLAMACRSSAHREGPAPHPPGAATVPAVLHDAVDRATRDRFRQPDRVVAALGLKPGQRVADVGAGSGYLTFRLAEAVGTAGRVVATDIDDAALGALRAREPARANVITRRVAPDDPGLEPASYDLVLLSEVDHYLPDRVEYLRKLRAALAPGGRVAVTNRRSFRALMVAAAERAGYTVAGEVTDLPSHFLVFLRPAPR